MVESRGGWTILSSSLGEPIRDTSRSIVSRKDDESLSSSELLLRRGLDCDDEDRPSKWKGDGRRIRLFRDPPPRSRAAVPPDSDASNSTSKAK